MCPEKPLVRMVTLGCSKNQVDSEKLLGQLDSKRFRLVHDQGPMPHTVIINTCGFIQDARQESIDEILEWAMLRKKGDVRQLIVMGCLSQRYREELEKEIPEVDAWFGVEGPQALLARLGQPHQALRPRRILANPGHYAYLKISEGCDRSCSFCAIPRIRGSHRSLAPEELVDEARHLAGKGVKELLLVAQDLSQYGRDLPGGRSRLLPLLHALAEVAGIEWIRLHYAYPVGFPMGVLSFMRSHPKICRYLDMPFQHISDPLLRSMRRGHTHKSTMALIERMRREVPGLALRTTLLLGYPGETEKDFRQLEDFVQAVGFERLGVFTYSAEEDTAAYALGDTVPEAVKQERAARIMEIQEDISLKHNQSRIGNRLRVIIDAEEADVYTGRTEYDSPEVDNEVLIRKDRKLSVGEFAWIKPTAASAHDLFAGPVS